jgi:hypothetical protein
LLQRIMIPNQAFHAHALTGRQHAFGIVTCAICPSCAREHRDDARLCTECGTPLTLAVCAACEAINAIDAGSCHQCGARFEREPWNIDAGPAPAVDDLPESPVEDVAFVLDAAETTVAFPSCTDDVIALGEKRYVGPDARQHPLADATPIAFAERALHALPLAEAPFTGTDAPRNVRTLTPARRAHLGVAFAVIVVAGAVGYWAFDVPTLRGVVANSLARADAIASLVSPAGVRPHVERADNRAAHAPSVATISAPVPAGNGPAPGATTGATATPTDALPERASKDASAIKAPAAPSARDVQTERPAATKPRSATVRHRPSARAHSQAAPSSQADRGAVATQRLIERDLGRFIAK